MQLSCLLNLVLNCAKGRIRYPAKANEGYTAEADWRPGAIEETAKTRLGDFLLCQFETKFPRVGMGEGVVAPGDDVGHRSMLMIRV